MLRKKKINATEYAVAKPETIAQLDELSVAVRDGVGGADNPFSEALALAGAVVHLRAALTPEVMSPIMALQSTPIGFRTDKDMKKTPSGYVPGPGYPVEVVRDAVIECCRLGARLVGNEMNLIGGRVYLTKEFFARKLDDAVGRGNWRMFHELPKTASGGAIVKSRVQWRQGDSAEWSSETLEFAIKGDGYSSADQYAGKADRKASAWLYRQITGEAVPEGDAGDAIDVESRPVYERHKAARESSVEAAAEAVPELSAESAVAGPSFPEGEAPDGRPRPMGVILSEFRKIVDIPGADLVNEYLRGINWILEGETFANVSEDRIRQIVKNRDGFIAAVFGDKPETDDVEV